MSEYGVSINDDRGYPCPKDGAILQMISVSLNPPRMPGAWCPQCHTVWRELDEVGLGDLDAV